MYRIFLSTLSLRRATNNYGRIHNVQIISIHALLAESDSLGYVRGCFFCVFLSTLSLRRATHSCVLWPAGVGYFYPRSPCGERLINNVINGINKIFLSTLSLRRATSTSL